MLQPLHDTTTAMHTDIRDKRILLDRCRFGPLSHFAWYRPGEHLSEPEPAVQQLTLRASVYHLSITMWWYSGLPLAPIGR
jgi:hypothetical protein